MKRFLTFIFCALFSVALFAKKPVVEQQTPSNETYSRIEVVNDSTIIYYHVLGIQVAQPDNVYTGIFRYNPYSKKKTLELCTMTRGAYIWIDPEGGPGTYILYASKAFDRVVLRAKEE